MRRPLSTPRLIRGEMVLNGPYDVGAATGYFKLPKIELETCKGLAPLISINVVGLIFNTYCLQFVDASFYQVRGLVSIFRFRSPKLTPGPALSRLDRSRPGPPFHRPLLLFLTSNPFLIGHLLSSRRGLRWFLPRCLGRTPDGLDGRSLLRSVFLNHHRRPRDRRQEVVGSCEG